MLITFDKICLVLTYNAESPTARRRAESWQAVETFHETSLHLRDADASIAAPERPNIKEKTAVRYDLPLLENIFSKEGC